MITLFAVLYEKIRTHLREMTTNSAKVQSRAPKNEHLDGVSVHKSNINALVQTKERSLHSMYKHRFSIEQ